MGNGFYLVWGDDILVHCGGELHYFIPFLNPYLGTGSIDVRSI